MTEAFVQQLIGHRAVVKSAGITPRGGGANALAIAVMKKNYGLDISSHTTKGTDDFDLNTFDRIVVLDVQVYTYMLHKYPYIAEKLEIYEIEDPFGGTEMVYKRCAESIKIALNTMIDKN